MKRILLYSCLGFAGFSSISSLIFYFGEWDRMIYLFVLGLFLGLVAAPQIEPKAFKHPHWFQFFGGLFFGLGLAIFLQLETSHIIAVTAIGGALGITASYWIGLYLFLNDYNSCLVIFS